MTERLQDALKILIFNKLKQSKGKKKTHPKQKTPVMALKKKNKERNVGKNFNERTYSKAT